jgi:hypothetical protein
MGDLDVDLPDPDFVAMDERAPRDPLPVHVRAVRTPQILEEEPVLSLELDPTVLTRDVRDVERKSGIRVPSDDPAADVELEAAEETPEAVDAEEREPRLLVARKGPGGRWLRRLQRETL